MQNTQVSEFPGIVSINPNYDVYPVSFDHFLNRLVRLSGLFNHCTAFDVRFLGRAMEIVKFASLAV